MSGVIVRHPRACATVALFSGVTSTDYTPVVDFDLRSLCRNLLLIVAILFVLVIGEMILVSAEEPAPSVQEQALLEAPRAE